MKNWQHSSARIVEAIENAPPHAVLIAGKEDTHRSSLGLVEWLDRLDITCLRQEALDEREAWREADLPIVLLDDVRMTEPRLEVFREVNRRWRNRRLAND